MEQEAGLETERRFCVLCGHHEEVCLYTCIEILMITYKLMKRLGLPLLIFGT